jgi:excisionase family DNA binding protein
MRTQILHDFAEAARLLSVSRSMLYRQIAAGKLRSVHIGGRHLIPADALESLIREAA